jgi:hypothetical protein
VNRLLRKFALAASTAAALLFASSTFAQTANSFFPTEGGRTTLTLSSALIAEITSAGAKLSTVPGAQLDGNQVAFGLGTGEINLANAQGQIVHNGGITLTAGMKQITLDSFMLTTFGDQDYISALVIANGRIIGRINVFDITLSSDLTLPITPKSGDFFLSAGWNLDPAGASALNDALGVTAFRDSVYAGYSLSLVLVPLAADPPATTTTSN